MALLVEVWDDQSLLESGSSHGLSKLGEKQLLLAHKLDLVLLVIAELYHILIELKSALGWVLALEVLHVVMARDLILCNLGDWVTVGGEESLFLVEDL